MNTAEDSPNAWAWGRLERARKLLAQSMHAFAEKYAGDPTMLKTQQANLELALDWFVSQQDVEPAAYLLQQLHLVWEPGGEWDTALDFSKRLQSLADPWRRTQADTEYAQMVWTGIQLVKSSALTSQGFWDEGLAVMKDALEETGIVAGSAPLLLQVLDQLRLAPAARRRTLSDGFLNQLIAAFEALGEPRLHGNALEIVAQYLATCGDTGGALALLQKKVQLDGQLQDATTMISTLQTLAAVASAAGYADAAAECLAEAERLSASHLPERDVIGSVQDRADLALKQERYAEAAELYQTVIETARRREDRHTLAHALRMYAFAAEELDQDVTAILEESLELSRQLRDFAGMARSFIQLGELAEQKGAPEMALRHFDTARNIAEQINDKGLLGAAWQRLGDLAGEQERWLEARGHYERGIQVLGMDAESDLSAQMLQRLGRVYVELGDLAGADRALRASAELWAALADRESYASCLFDRACVAAREGRVKDAHSLADRAMKTLREINSVHCAEIDEALAYLNSLFPHS